MTACENEELKLNLFGEPIKPTEEAAFKKLLKHILCLNKDISNFIGNYPVNLYKNTVDLLLENDYLVCEKTDGIRAFLICCNNKMYFYDRTNYIYEVKSMGFTTSSIYIFDGEIYVNNKDHSYVFAIFDCVVFSNICIASKNLYVRLDHASKFVQKLLPAKLSEIPNATHKLFKIYLKCFLKAYGCKQILDNIKNFNHDNDGLVFTPVQKEYEFYTRTKILKWKPAELQTVDFIVEETHKKYEYDLLCVFEGRQMEQLYSKEMHKEEKKCLENCKSNKKISIWQPDGEVPKDIDGKICEFFWNNKKEIMDEKGYISAKGGWDFLRIRSDKTEPNNIKIVLTQMECEKFLLSQENLVELTKEIKNNAKERENKVHEAKRQKQTNLQ